MVHTHAHMTASMFLVFGIAGGGPSAAAHSGCPGDCWPQFPDGTFGNGQVNVDDLVAVVNAFGPGAGPCDVAPVPFGNGDINIDDLVFVVNAFGTCAAQDNDFCDQPMPLFVNAPPVVSDNFEATLESNFENCKPGEDGLSDGSAPFQVSGGRWFCVLGTGNELTVETCGDPEVFDFSFYQTFINVYCNDCVNLPCIGDSADTTACVLGPFASMSFCSTDGQVYLILVHGLSNELNEGYHLEVIDDGLACGNATSCIAP
jgi:hypothetical protein